MLNAARPGLTFRMADTRGALPCGCWLRFFAVLLPVPDLLPFAKLLCPRRGRPTRELCPVHCIPFSRSLSPAGFVVFAKDLPVACQEQCQSLHSVAPLLLLVIGRTPCHQPHLVAGS